MALQPNCKLTISFRVLITLLGVPFNGLEGLNVPLSTHITTQKLFVESSCNSLLLNLESKMFSNQSSLNERSLGVHKAHLSCMTFVKGRTMLVSLPNFALRGGGEAVNFTGLLVPPPFISFKEPETMQTVENSEYVMRQTEQDKRLASHGAPTTSVAPAAATTTGSLPSPPPPSSPSSSSFSREIERIERRAVSHRRRELRERQRLAREAEAMGTAPPESSAWEEDGEKEEEEGEEELDDEVRTHRPRSRSAVRVIPCLQ